MRQRRSILLYPLSLLYDLITSLRNFLYNTEILKSVSFGIPVICVGNLTAGGTGKTPMTEYLAGLLGKEYNLAVLSRGYKRRSSGFLIASDSSGPDDLGDEPFQIAEKFPGITVAVDRKRVHGIRKLLKLKPEINVIILDDAFQHRTIKPGYSILLTAFGRLMTKDKLLPYGNLRENISNTKRADIIIVTKTPESLPPIERRLISKDIQKAAYQSLFFTSVKYGPPLPVFSDVEAEKNILFSRGKTDKPDIIMVTGIANPESLHDYLKKFAVEVIPVTFGDHHRFSSRDIKTITEKWESLRSSRKYLITTEKDAVRLREFTNIAGSMRNAFYYIPVGISFLNDEKAEFDKMIIEYVRENKPINRIS